MSISIPIPGKGKTLQLLLQVFAYSTTHELIILITFHVFIAASASDHHCLDVDPLSHF